MFDGGAGFFPRDPRIARATKTIRAMPLTRNRMLRRLTGCLSSDAVRALSLLAGGIGADRRPLDDDPGVDRHGLAVDLEGEPVETPRGRSALLLADPVVLRTVAGALEPLRCLAPGHAAPEMDTLLEQRHEAGFHPGKDRVRVHLLGGGQRGFRIGVDVGPSLRHVEGLLLLSDGVEDVLLA